MNTILSHKREWAVLLTLAGIQFTHILDFMIMMPLGPQLIEAFGIADAQFGLLVSAYTFSAGFSGLVASLYIDKFERRKLLLSLYALFALATLACGLAPTYETLMSARVAAGLFGGVLTALVQTIVADIIPFERRGKAMGVVMTAFSVSSVLGVPIGLYIATYADWHAPFIAIGLLSLLLVLGALYSLPKLADHLHHPERTGARQNLKQVVIDSNHWRGFLFSFSMVFAGFSVIPYITLYMQINAGVPERDIPLIYLIGGGATLFSAQIIGRLSDRYGKVKILHVVATLAMIPIGVLPFTEYFPFWLILVCSTAFFIFVSGRMIPGMALLTSASNPRLRGTFMTLNSSMQSAGMGLAAFVGGLIIARGPDGHLQYYWVCSVVALISNAIAMWLATRLEIRK